MSEELLMSSDDVLPSAASSPVPVVPDDDVSPADFGFIEKPEGGDQSSPAATPTPVEYQPGDSYLAETARRFGFTDSDIASYGSDRALRAAVDREQRYQQAWYQQQQQLQALQAQRQQQQPQPQRPQLPQWKNPLTGQDDIDPRLAKSLDEVNQYYQGILGPTFQAIQGLHQQQAAMVQHLQTQAQQAQLAEQNRQLESFYDKADSAISALGEQYERFVGKGSVKGEARDPQFVQVQDALIQKAAAIAGTEGKPWNSLTQADCNKYVKKAALAEFGDHMESLAQQKVVDQVRQRQSMIQPRQNTSSRRAAPVGENSKAVRFLEQLDRT